MTNTPDTVTVTMTRTAALRSLYQMMSDASEAQTCAGWLTGWEDTFPRLARKIVANGEPHQGWSGDVTVSEAELMCAFADALGSWVRPVWDEPAFRLEAYVPPSERQEV